MHQLIWGRLLGIAIVGKRRPNAVMVVTRVYRSLLRFRNGHSRQVCSRHLHHPFSFGYHERCSTEFVKAAGGLPFLWKNHA